MIATGIASVATQLLTIREFLAQLNGNEFVIALILFNWLVLGGIGTLVARRVHTHSKTIADRLLAWLSLCLAALSPVQLLMIRELRDVVFIHGTSVGFYPTCAYIALTTAPYCLLVGFLLPYSLFILKERVPGFHPARIYIADNLGDVAGGALFSFLLVHIVTPLQAAGIASLPLLAVLVRMVAGHPAKRRSLVAGLCIALVIIGLCILYEPLSLAPPEGRLIEYRESRYGRIEIRQDGDLYTLFSDGMPAFSTGYQNLSEEAIHYPLSQLDTSVNNLLLISAQGGMLAQAAKYRPNRIDYVEIDPDVSTALFRHNLLARVPNLHVVNQDGRKFLSTTRRHYDAVILNLPEPANFQINRFFTDQFFALVKQRLAVNGIFSFSVKGYDNYLSQAHRDKVSSLFNTASEHFSHILLFPGENIFFLCRNAPLYRDIPERLRQKRIDTDFIRSYFYGNLSDQRIDRLNRLVDTSVPANRDMSPKLMNIMFAQWFGKFSTSPVAFYAVITILIAAYLVRLKAEEFVLFSTGCMTMGTEIMVIFAFQLFFGYIYFQIGIIVTVFLAGLLPGAWLGDRLQRNSKHVLVVTDIILILLSAGFIPVLQVWGNQLPMSFFLVYGFLVSVSCGCQFPAALFVGSGDNPSAARLFSADLIGAACGILIASVVLIPYVGVAWTAAALVGLKITSLLMIGIKT